MSESVMYKGSQAPPSTSPQTPEPGVSQSSVQHHLERDMVQASATAMTPTSHVSLNPANPVQRDTIHSVDPTSSSSIRAMHSSSPCSLLSWFPRQASLELQEGPRHLVTERRTTTLMVHWRCCCCCRGMCVVAAPCPPGRAGGSC